VKGRHLRKRKLTVDLESTSSESDQESATTDPEEVITLGRERGQPDHTSSDCASTSSSAGTGAGHKHPDRTVKPRHPSGSGCTKHTENKPQVNSRSSQSNQFVSKTHSRKSGKVQQKIRSATEVPCRSTTSDSQESATDSA